MISQYSVYQMIMSELFVEHMGYSDEAKRKKYTHRLEPVNDV